MFCAPVCGLRLGLISALNFLEEYFPTQRGATVVTFEENEKNKKNKIISVNQVNYLQSIVVCNKLIYKII